MDNQTVKKTTTPRPRRKPAVLRKAPAVKAGMRGERAAAATSTAPARASAAPDKMAAAVHASRGGFSYYTGVGRRKEAVARVRVYVGQPGDIIVNGKAVKKYFPYFEFTQIAEGALEAVGRLGKMAVTAIASGGGGKAQAEAVRLGIARALVKYDENLKKTLRPLGYLTRDSRAKERKKPGLKRARRAPQFAKR